MTFVFSFFFFEALRSPVFYAVIPDLFGDFHFIIDKKELLVFIGARQYKKLNRFEFT